jgi:hypothetical protein
MTTGDDPVNGGDQRDADAALERFGNTLRSAAVWERPRHRQGRGLARR